MDALRDAMQQAARCAAQQRNGVSPEDRIKQTYSLSVSYYYICNCVLCGTYNSHITEALLGRTYSAILNYPDSLGTTTTVNLL